MTSSKPIVVTGAAGFIGAALVMRLLSLGEKVIGIDSLNNYYDPLLKTSRLVEIDKYAEEISGKWSFYQLKIEDEAELISIFSNNKPKYVVNLAAQAGVRYSIDNPSAYVQANLVGFGNVLEACRKFEVEHLIYASSSSVYGGNLSMPFKEEDAVNHPVSLYAATKKANELMAHTYSHLYGIPATGLRFFTVYGPWGRPDMAPMIFSKAILLGNPIKVYNYGNMKRDFTYIDDIIEGVVRCCYKPATKDDTFDPLRPNPSTAAVPHRIFNIGNSNPTSLIRFIELLEELLGKKALKDFQPIQPGDVKSTAADTNSLQRWIGFKPIIPIEIGLEKFAIWYREFYKI